MTTITGTSGNDILAGTLGDDLIYGLAGNDELDGLSGNDTAVYAGARAGYDILYDVELGKFLIKDLNVANGDEGTDTLTQVEHLQFSDQTLSLGAPPEAWESVVLVPVDGTASGHLTGKGSGLTYEIEDGAEPAHGTLTVNLDGTFTYVPDSGYGGYDSFQYRVTDAQGIASVAEVKVGVGEPGQQLGHSALFENGDGSRLTQTFSNGDTQSWTWSGWVKLDELGSYRALFTDRATSNTTGLVFNDNNQLEAHIANGATTQIIRTTATFTDTSNWIHIVWAVDTTQATASERNVLYINGERVTSLAVADYPPQNYSSRLNTAVEHSIGVNSTSNPFYFDGYMADVNFVDGQQLDASAFGKFSGTAWLDKEYTGTYGTNGFHLGFDDSDALGADSSGNDNDWSPVALVQSDQGPETGVHLDPTSGNDVFVGTGIANQFSGLDGDDVLNGGGGADTLTGGEGNDTLIGGTGADVLDGGAGLDWVAYSASAAAVTVNLTTGTGTGGDAQGDTLTAIENITGSAFNDSLTGDAGANHLHGGDGNDTIDGLGGVDNIRGGAGNDTINSGDGDDGILGGAGADILSGGNGNDTIGYIESNAGVTINLATQTVSGGDATGDSISGFESAIGSDHNDTIYGTSSTNFLFGGNGNDGIEGGAGGDYLDGGDGVDAVGYVASSAGVTVDIGYNTATGGDATGDTIANFESLGGSAFADILLGSDGDNAITGGSGADQIDGRGGNDLIYGESGSDVIFGRDGSDSLLGDDGDDIIRGGAANDALVGGVGADLFQYTAMGDAGDYIYDFSTGQGDKIDLSLLFDALGYAGTDPRGAGYLSVVQNGANTDVRIDADGSVNGSSFQTLVTLGNVTASTITDSYFIFQ